MYIQIIISKYKLDESHKEIARAEKWRGREFIGEDTRLTVYTPLHSLKCASNVSLSLPLSYLQLVSVFFFSLQFFSFKCFFFHCFYAMEIHLGTYSSHTRAIPLFGRRWTRRSVCCTRPLAVNPVTGPLDNAHTRIMSRIFAYVLRGILLFYFYFFWEFGGNRGQHLSFPLLRCPYLHLNERHTREGFHWTLTFYFLFLREINNIHFIYCNKMKFFLYILTSSLNL